MVDPLSPPGGFARILAVAGPAHGDILLMTPLLRSLRHAFPRAAIDVLVYRGQSPILEGNPDVNDVISASKHPGLREYRGLFRRIARRYDLALSNKQTDRAVTYAWLAGRRRVAVVPVDRQPWKRRFMSAYVPYDHDDTHTLLQNNALGTLLGLDPCYEMRLPYAAESAAVIDDLLAPPFAGRPFAVLHLNPGLPHKRWTIAGWRAVVADLERRGLPIVLTGDGSDAEKSYVRTVTEGLDAPLLDLGGRLRFAHVSELLSRCSVYIGTDTVVTHIAAANGVPTVALFGPESSRVWGPWPKGYARPESPYAGGGDQRVGNVFLLQSDVPCPTCRQGYCRRRSERNENCNLMRTLAPEKVAAATREILGPPETSANDLQSAGPIAGRVEEP